MSKVQERLDSARQRLEAARLLLRHEFESDAMSRLYFGVLESARALLLLQDLTPKTHKGIGMKVGQHFRAQVDVGLLTKLRQNREKADYNLRMPTPEEADRYIEEAEQFIESASTHIEEVI